MVGSCLSQKAVAGDFAAVKELADITQQKVAVLQAKIDRLKGGTPAAPPGSTPGGVPEQMTVTVPAGVGPGGQFMALTPFGETITVTVPPHAGPGQSIVVDVHAAVPVVIGVPVE